MYIATEERGPYLAIWCIAFPLMQVHNRTNICMAKDSVTLNIKSTLRFKKPKIRQTEKIPVDYCSDLLPLTEKTPPPYTK